MEASYSSMKNNTKFSKRKLIDDASCGSIQTRNGSMEAYHSSMKSNTNSSKRQLIDDTKERGIIHPQYITLEDD